MYLLYIYIYIYIYIYTVKLVYNNTLGVIKMCCSDQVVLVTRTFGTETIESVPAVCCCKEVDVVNSDFLTKFHCIYVILY